MPFIVLLPWSIGKPPTTFNSGNNGLKGPNILFCKNIEDPSATTEATLTCNVGWASSAIEIIPPML